MLLVWEPHFETLMGNGGPGLHFSRGQDWWNGAHGGMGYGCDPSNLVVLFLHQCYISVDFYSHMLRLLPSNLEGHCCISVTPHFLGMKLSQFQSRGRGLTKIFMLLLGLDKQCRKMLFLLPECWDFRDALMNYRDTEQNVWIQTLPGNFRPLIIEPKRFSAFLMYFLDPFPIFGSRNTAFAGVHLTLASSQPAKASAKGKSPPTLVSKGFEMLIRSLEIFWQPGMLFRAIRHLDYYRSVKGKLLLPKKSPGFSRESSEK